MSNLLAESSIAGPISDAHLETFESQLGTHLPSLYREFLRGTNGGLPSHRGLSYFNEVEEEERQTEFECFYSLNDKEWPDAYKWRLHESLDRVFERVVQRNKPSIEVVPVGRDVAGNLVVIWVGGENVGEIGFFDHDYDEIFFLAESFDAFCNSLTELPVEMQNS